MKRIVLGPFNRVEGDLEVSLDVDAGQVVSARVNSPLFRGFEQMLIGRAPEDALAIVPRICGICSVAQSAAAAAALAQIAGIKPPENGQLACKLVMATENLADHLSHFYLFFMPDFTRTEYADRSWYGDIVERFAAIKGAAASPALQARARFFNLMGFLAGRWPHSLAVQPGGSTKAMTPAERVRILAILREFRTFLEQVLLGDSLESFAALNSEDALLAWADGRQGDFPLFLRAANELGLNQVGRATDHFMSYGAYGLFSAGIWQPNVSQRSGFMRGTVSSVKTEKITEDTRHAWLVDGEPKSPVIGETRVNAEKAEAYTWCKAPRYGEQVLEVGALARQVVSGNWLARDLVGQHGGSVSARVIARMIELASIVPAMEAWVRQIVPGEPFCERAPLPDSGTGMGLVEAARGGLGHWLSIKNRRIERYQIIAPTTWNFSPRDGSGQPGPLEQALVGLPAGEGALPTIQHVVRSFDPCMVCTVH